MRVKYYRRSYGCAYSKAWCSVLKIEKISDTCVSNIDMHKREVYLEGYEEAFHYEKDSLALLLQKAMTRKATFITKDRVIDWIDLKKNVPTNAYTEVLQESEKRFIDLAEQSPNMIFMSQKDRIVYVNKRCEEILGYKKEEFYSPDFNRSLLFTPELRDQMKSVRRRLLKGEEIAPLELELVTKEGKKINTTLTPKLIELDGEPTILGIVTDITERKAIEKSLSQSEEKYHSFVNNVPVDIWTMDSKDNQIFVNPNVEKLLGYTPEEVLQGGNSFWNERTHTQDRKLVDEAYNMFFSKRKTGDIEYRMQRKDGTWIWIHDKVVRVYEKNGVLYADGITWEITQGKKAEKTLSTHL